MNVRCRRAVSRTLAGIGLALLAAGPVARVEAWWTCEPGLNFEVSGTKARCVKAAETLTATPHCPAGSQLKVDLVGRSDRCQKPDGYHVGPGCSTGYSLAQKTGADSCQKQMGAIEKAPSMNVP